MSQHPEDADISSRNDVETLPPARLQREITLPLPSGATALLGVFEGLVDGRDDHISLSFLRPGQKTPLVRLHSSCLTGDVFGSLRCDCGQQLSEALDRCAREGGVVLYLHQEGRGIGLRAKLAAYALQDAGLDTFAANRALGFADDERDYRVAAQMLLALGISRIRLLSNNPDKVAQLERWGLLVEACEPTAVHLTPHNQRYLLAKRDQGHQLTLEPAATTSTQFAGV